MITTFITIKEALLDLVFPVKCISCGAEGCYLCAHCGKNLKRNQFQLCPACGSPSPFGFTHASCKTPETLDGLISAVPYKEPLARKLVEFCKYRFISGISSNLGEMMSEEILNLEMLAYLKKFLLVPLPLHSSKKRWRGFNQAELIAGTIAKKLEITMRPDLLVRKKKTKTQAELQDAERVLNVKNAFYATQNLKGKRIIVVDDVSTTRSTLAEACRALKQAGAEEVWGLVFAQG